MILIILTNYLAKKMIDQNWHEPMTLEQDPGGLLLCQAIFYGKESQERYWGSQGSGE